MLYEKPRRLSRREMQEGTRQKLLEAATEIIAKGGVSAMTIRGVCEAAGYSQGAFYSNFENMPNLLLDVMEGYILSKAVKLRNLLQKADKGDVEGALEILAAHLSELASKPQWSLLALEFQIYAQRNEEFSARYAECKKIFHNAIATLLAEVIDRHNLQPALPPEQMAIGLNSLWYGMVAFGNSEGAMPRDAMLLAFFKVLVGLEKTPKPTKN
jgi:AcrR family transcriptional regulator